MTDETKAADSLRIFISYSRKDAATADALVAALEAEHFAVTIDRRDLPYGERWQDELGDFIHAADTVLWLISAASLASRWCHWELGEAQRASKRLVPLAIESVSPDTLPEELGRIHILPPTGSFDVATHLKTLVEVLNTDRNWVKEHTRLADRARQWQARAKSTALLLRGDALTEAERWQGRRPAAAPAPSESVLSLLLASRTAQARRQRVMIAGSVLVATVGMGLAGAATWQWQVAEEQRTLAQARAVAEQAARQTAEQNFSVARSTIDSVVENVVSGLQNTEGISSEAVRAILERVGASVDALASTAPEDSALQATRANMLVQFGDAYLRAGDSQAASAAYADAISLLQPTNTMALSADERLSLAEVEIRYATALGMAGQHGDALTSWLAAEALLDDLPSDDAQKRLRANTLAGKAGTFVVRRAYEDARPLLAEAVALREALASAHPSDLTAQHELAAVLIAFGTTNLESGAFEGASEAYGRALVIAQKNAEASPTDTRFRHSLASAHHHHGNLLKREGRLFEAINSFDESQRILSMLFDEDPWSVSLQRDLVRAHTEYGRMHVMLLPAEALPPLQIARSLATELVDLQPEDISAQLELATIEDLLAERATRLWQDLLDDPSQASLYRTEAIEMREAALDTRQKIIALTGETPASLEQLSNAHSALSGMLIDGAATKEAQAHAIAALTAAEKRAKLTPDHPGATARVASMLVRLERLATPEESLELLQRAQRILAGLQDKNALPDGYEELSAALDMRLSPSRP